MSASISLENQLGWKYFGKRYLRAHEFISLCDAVGIYSCTEAELEQYEKERLLFPVARVVMPDDYACLFYRYMDGLNSEGLSESLLPFHRLNWALRYQIQMPSRDINNQDFRHPVDINKGSIDGLREPIQQEYKPWENYVVECTTNNHTSRHHTATHYYHYWQLYELYQVRKSEKGMYKDKCLLTRLEGSEPAYLQSLSHLFDATSYFRHLHNAFSSLFFYSIDPNNDGQIVLSQTQQNELEDAMQRYATDTISTYALDKSIMFRGLRHMMEIHVDYERADRVRLANVLRRDIWETAKLIHFSLGIPTEDISTQVGPVTNLIGIGNYLELLYPNRREQVRSKSHRILNSFVNEHNRHTTHYSISDDDIDQLLNYTEATELAWFEYIVNEVNDSFLEQHSWSVASNLLGLQSLASFPESFMKTLILKNGDTQTQTDFSNGSQTFHPTIDVVYRNTNPSILSHLQQAGHWSANNSSEFSQNLTFLLAALVNTSSEEEFIGVNLAITILLRNFTSHSLIEDAGLLQGRYIQCLRAIITTIFSSFFVARDKNWI